MSKALSPYRDFSLVEAVRTVLPFAPDDVATFLLWETTAFPFEPITDSLHRLDPAW